MLSAYVSPSFCNCYEPLINPKSLFLHIKMIIIFFWKREPLKNITFSSWLTEGGQICLNYFVLFNQLLWQFTPAVITVLSKELTTFLSLLAVFQIFSNCCFRCCFCMYRGRKKFTSCEIQNMIYKSWKTVGRLALKGAKTFFSRKNLDYYTHNLLTCAETM